MKKSNDAMEFGSLYATIAANGNQVWHLKYKDPHTLKWTPVSATIKSGKHYKKCPAEAYNQLEQKAREKNRKYFIRTTQVTISEAVEEWLEPRRHEVAESTNICDRSSLKQFQNEFGKWLVTKIETAHLQEFMDTYVSKPGTKI
jgi:hypothetical protein